MVPGFSFFCRDPPTRDHEIIPFNPLALAGIFILLQRPPEITWKTALENIKGVYLICDRLTGKHYVGSAYGEYAFWSRWSQYALTGHGYNMELVALLTEKGYAYATNFHFSILEKCTKITSDEEIIARECHWKVVLMSRQFGYNCN